MPTEPGFISYRSSVSLAFSFCWFFLSTCLNLFYLLLLKLFPPLLQPYTPLQLDGLISTLFHLVYSSPTTLQIQVHHHTETAFSSPVT